jgi:AraC family transcriptional regulator of arabinose operon
METVTHPDQEFLASPPRVRPVSPPTYWRCEPGWSWHARPLPDHLLWCVLEGVGHVSLGGRRTQLGPGTGVVFEPGDEPVAGHDPRQRLLIFGMHFELGDDHTPRKDRIPGRVCRLRDTALVTALARRCENSYGRGDPLGTRQSQLCLELLLGLVWGDSIHPAPRRVDGALDEITHHIRADPSRRWTVAELAGLTALSRAQFTRRFTAHAGMSPLRYLIRARIDRAHQLLTETNMSISQVAATLGYTDVAYFSRQYERYRGCPPRAAR